MGVEIFKLAGKVAWITGGSKGLGLQMATALAGVGADVVITSRHGDEAEAAAKHIAQAHGVRAVGMAADVTSLDQARAVVERAAAELGPIDILINNAGINVRKSTLDLSLEEWQQVIDINLAGPFICAKAAAPGMVARKWGRIIHISSTLGLVGLGARPAYTASKGGLVLLTRTQAIEFAASGITVNAICPGPFATEMNKPLLDDPEKYKTFAAKIPMGRWGELSELDSAVIFLASPASSYVTGIALPVDGGWTAW